MADSDITQKLWNYCHVLLADGMHFSGYLEQLGWQTRKRWVMRRAC